MPARLTGMPLDVLAIFNLAILDHQVVVDHDIRMGLPGDLVALHHALVFRRFPPACHHPVKSVPAPAVFFPHPFQTPIPLGWIVGED